MSTLEGILAEATKAQETKQYELAVDLFGEACRTYALAHEDQENPDILFQYGNALFELGKSNATLLNTDNVDQTSRSAAVPEMVELEVVPEGEKTSEQLAAEQRAEMQKIDKPEEESKEFENVEPDQSGDDGDVGPDNEEQPAGEEKQPKNDDAQEKQAEETDEVDDFTAAWQMIDLCRVLYSRELELAKDKKSIKAKLAKVYGLLGEISIEDDNYEQAAIDFQSALETKQEILDSNDRLLSEAHFMLALALEMKGDKLDDKKAALQHMQSAVDIAKKAGVDQQSILDLRQKVHDLKKEVDTMASNPSAPSNDSSADRDAALKSMLSMLGGAQDIGGLVKRKLDAGHGDTSGLNGSSLSDKAPKTPKNE